MEKLSRNELLECNGGSFWTAIAGLIINAIYIASGIKRLIRRKS